MRLKKRIIASNSGISVREFPIPPVDLQNREVPLKMERVLITPLDYIILSGKVNRTFLGTLGYGKVLEKASVNIPENASIYPIGCSNLPPIGRDGVGSEIYPYPIELLKKPPKELEYPEMLFIYDTMAELASLAEGTVLIIGGEGLQTAMLSKLLNNAVITGVKKRIGEAQVISYDKLQGTSWDTVIVNSVNLALIDLSLKVIKWNKLVINPFSACYIRQLPIGDSHSFTVSVAFPSKSRIKSTWNYDVLENVVKDSGMHEEVSLNEIDKDFYTQQYVTVLFEG